MAVAVRCALLLACLLLFSYTRGCVVHESNELKTGVFLEPSHHVLKRQATSPFRLTIHYDPSFNTSLEESLRNRLKDVTLSRIKDFLETTLMVRSNAGTILLDRDCVNGTFFRGNDNIMQCADACSSLTKCGPVTVPEEHLKACVQCNHSNPCQPITLGVPGAGVNNSDFILYVSAINSVSCGTGNSISTIAFASACQMEATLDRPIAGYVNFCPESLANLKDSKLFAVTKHEILHALAFSTTLFPFWRNETGSPRTTRDSAGFPPKNPMTGRFTWGNTTIRSVTYKDWEVAAGNISHTVQQMVTPRVVEEARIHFGCPTLEGVELENQGGPSTAISHWEKRILGDEGMTGVLTGVPVFSRITLAALEDSGWYTVDYSSAEELLWGQDASCDFAQNSCLRYKRTQQERQKSISPFCDQDVQSSRLGCTIERGSVSKCNIMEFPDALQEEYQYYSNSNEGGSLELADFCPYQKGFANRVCSESSNQLADVQNILAESYGMCSQCFEQTRWTTASVSGLQFGGGCYQYSCSSEGELSIIVAGKSHACPSANTEVTVSGIVGGRFFSGTVLCSSADELCSQESNSTSCPIITSTTPTTVSTTPNSGDFLSCGVTTLAVAVLIAISSVS